MLPCAARVRLCDHQSRAVAQQTRISQAGSDLEHRGRFETFRRATGARRSTACCDGGAHAGVLQKLRFAADAGDDCRAVPDREPLCRRMRRQKVRQLRRMARYRLRHYARLLSGAVVTVRVHRIGSAGRIANGGSAARRSTVTRRREGIGRYSGRTRHHTDRPQSRTAVGARSRGNSRRNTAIWALVNGPPAAIIRVEKRSILGEANVTEQAASLSADDHLDIHDVQRRVKAIFIGSVGNLVEWYDFYAYTAFALYFAPAFFPNSDPVVQQLNAAVLFAATFLVRPIGGWLFGYIADHHGRRLSLTLSVLCMCFGSLMIAVTPTYASIGFAAPAILALARVIEGLSLGGEYGASATYLSEVAGAKHRGFYSSFQYGTLSGGQRTAIMVLLLLQKVFLTPEELKAWGWRIPFVIGAALAIIAAIMRRNLHETEAFEEAKKVVKPTGSILGLLQYPRELLLVVGLTAGGTAAFYTFTTYMQTFVRQSVGLTEDQTTTVIFGSLIFATILQPIYGAISDRIGRKPVLMFFGVVGTLATVPILTELKASKSPAMAFLLICAAWIFTAGYTSINAVVKAELFPTKIRAMGVGLPYSITVSIFGGTAPAVALYFKSLGHEEWFYYYLSGIIFLSLLIYSTMRDTKHESAMHRHE